MSGTRADAERGGLAAVPIIYFEALALDRSMELSEWFSVARDLGLDGTEIHHRSLRSHERAHVEAVGEDLRRSGLAVSQIVGAADLTHPDPAVRETEVAATLLNVDLAVALGAECVRVTAGQTHVEVSHAQGVALAVDGIRRVGEYADARGVRAAYENHYKDYFWPQPDFSQRAAVFLEILDQLRDTPVGVNFDCSNQVMIGEDPVQLLRQVCDRVVHVHCSDRVAPNEYLHAVTGEGIVDYPAIFRLLREVGYDGWLSIEYNGTQGLDGLRRSVENVRRLWAESGTTAKDRGLRGSGSGLAPASIEVHPRDHA